MYIADDSDAVDGLITSGLQRMCGKSEENELLAAYIDITRQSPLHTYPPGAKSHESPLVDVVRGQQETINRMQDTLDRIVTSQYDRPVERTIHPVARPIRCRCGA